MKIAFWVIGAPCAGKSTAALKVAKELDTDVIHLDCVEDMVKIHKKTRKEGYTEMLKSPKDTIVIEGVQPYTFPHERGFIEGLLIDHKIIYAVVFPKHEEWLERREKRKAEGKTPLSPLMTKFEYGEYYKELRETFGKHLLIKDDSDLRKINQEAIRNLNYQHGGFTELKWAQLKIKPAGKTILDLGCGACWYEGLAKDAKKYTGLDCNFAYLINDNACFFDLNYLEEWSEKSDIVICSSVLHYIRDKAKFLHECARLTKGTFVLETPIAPGGGRRMMPIERGLEIPTKEMLEYLLGQAFRWKKVELIGNSIVEDKSERLIYHCK